MKKCKSAAIAPVLSVMVLLQPQLVSAAESQAAIEEEIIITAIRADRKSRGATGLDLDVYETPQSLTILESDTIDNFGLVDINSMLKMVTGVNVDSTETDRTYYNA